MQAGHRLEVGGAQAGQRTLPRLQPLRISLPRVTASDPVQWKTSVKPRQDQHNADQLQPPAPQASKPAPHPFQFNLKKFGPVGSAGDSMELEDSQEIQFNKMPSSQDESGNLQAQPPAPQTHKMAPPSFSTVAKAAPRKLELRTWLPAAAPGKRLGHARDSLQPEDSQEVKLKRIEVRHSKTLQVHGPAPSPRAIPPPDRDLPAAQAQPRTPLINATAPRPNPLALLPFTPRKLELQQVPSSSANKQENVGDSLQLQDSREIQFREIPRTRDMQFSLQALTPALSAHTSAPKMNPPVTRAPAPPTTTAASKFTPRKLELRQSLPATAQGNKLGYAGDSLQTEDSQEVHFKEMPRTQDVEFGSHLMRAPGPPLQGTFSQSQPRSLATPEMSQDREVTQSYRDSAMSQNLPDCSQGLPGGSTTPQKPRPLQKIVLSPGTALSSCQREKVMQDLLHSPQPSPRKAPKMTVSPGTALSDEKRERMLASLLESPAPPPPVTRQQEQSSGGFRDFGSFGFGQDSTEESGFTFGEETNTAEPGFNFGQETAAESSFSFFGSRDQEEDRTGGDGGGEFMFNLGGEEGGEDREEGGFAGLFD